MKEGARCSGHCMKNIFVFYTCLKKYLCFICHTLITLKKKSFLEIKLVCG